MLFRGILAYRMKGLLTGCRSWFFQLDTLWKPCCWLWAPNFQTPGWCREGRIPLSSRCSALHLFAQNSSLVESWFASIVVVAMHNKHTRSKDLWRTQHAVLIGFILLVIWTVFYNGWSFIQVMISDDLPYGLAYCYYIIELFGSFFSFIYYWHEL